MIKANEPSSFRDPSGFIFYREGICFRQINQVYKENYKFLLESGLHKKLVDDKLLIPHETADVRGSSSSGGYKTIRPEFIPFISYPYEWSFTQFKNAALTTLAILKHALNHGMILKDANAFNIQFYQGNPLLIDTLSFEKYVEGQPWKAYKQFCEHFLGPLALMSCKDIRLGQMIREHISGIPLDLVSSLLPRRTYLNFHLAIHIHLHARYQNKYSDKPSTVPDGRAMNRKSIFGLIDSLESFLKRLSWTPKTSKWIDYYQKYDHVPEFLEEKIKLVKNFLIILNPGAVWDLGANTGVFSRIASDLGIQTVSMDSHPGCVEINYRQTLERREKNLLPIWIDLNNPSPSIGWENKERMSLLERGPVETALALALIHHLAISNNVPLAKIAEFFSKVCQSMIIEFIPKSDPMVQKLLASREDIFNDYTQNGFEHEFLRFFKIHRSEKIGESRRVLYLLKKENHA